MPKAHFLLPDGSSRTIDVEEGWSLMEGARQAGIPGIVAECGGGLLCATCHVHVAEPWIERVGGAEGTEEMLLELAPGHDETSRLSCQIVVTEELDGLTVQVPEEQSDY